MTKYNVFVEWCDQGEPVTRNTGFLFDCDAGDMAAMDFAHGMALRTHPQRIIKRVKIYSRDNVPVEPDEQIERQA